MQPAIVAFSDVRDRGDCCVRLRDVESRPARDKSLLAKSAAAGVDRSLIAAIDDNVGAGRSERLGKHSAKPARCTGN